MIPRGPEEQATIQGIAESLARESRSEPIDHWAEAIGLYENSNATEVLPKPRPMTSAEISSHVRHIYGMRSAMGGATLDEAFEYYLKKFGKSWLEEDVAAMQAELQPRG